MSQHDASIKAISYALVANFSIALAKSWGAWFTGSGSMLAEAIHSYADTGNQVLLYLGVVQARRPADAEHPLGYGKLSYFWSFIVALMLFSLGGLFAIYEGIHKLTEPTPLSQPWVGLVILAFGVIVEGASFLGCLRQIKRLRGEKSLREWLRTTRNAELVVVLGEDLAAMIGLFLAFIFLGISAITENPMFDAIGSICIGVVLIIVSLFIAVRIKALIVGRSARPDLQAIIDGIIRDDPQVAQVFNVITFQIGPSIMLAAKIRLQAQLSVSEAAEHINALEVRLKAAVPEISWCFMEPDTTDC